MSYTAAQHRGAFKVPCFIFWCPRQYACTVYVRKMWIVLFELNSTNMPDSKRILLALSGIFWPYCENNTGFT